MAFDENAPIEEAEEQFKITPKLICNFAILVSIGMLLTAGGILYNEYSGAKERCNEFEGEFKFNFPAGYFCDDKPLIKYSEGGWDYEREFNISESRHLILP